MILRFQRNRWTGTEESLINKKKMGPFNFGGRKMRPLDQAAVDGEGEINGADQRSQCSISRGKISDQILCRASIIFEIKIMGLRRTRNLVSGRNLVFLFLFLIFFFVLVEELYYCHLFSVGISSVMALGRP